MAKRGTCTHSNTHSPPIFPQTCTLLYENWRCKVLYRSLNSNNCNLLFLSDKWWLNNTSLLCLSYNSHSDTEVPAVEILNALRIHIYIYIFFLNTTFFMFKILSQTLNYRGSSRLCLWILFFFLLLNVMLENELPSFGCMKLTHNIMTQIYDEKSSVLSALLNAHDKVMWPWHVQLWMNGF